MKIGEKWLITADNWFFAPDGENYRAVWGTVYAVMNDEEALGIKTNRNATNWFVKIGNMVIAGCQIHYAIRCDKVSFDAPNAEIDHEGVRMISRCSVTRIYNADRPA